MAYFISAWISSLVYAGYLFGNIPWVKEHLEKIVLGIIAISLLPVVITYFKERRAQEPPAR